MPSPIRTDTGWRVNFVFKGTRHRNSFPAKSLAEQFIREILTGNAPVTRPHIYVLVDQYVTWGQTVKGKSPKSTRCEMQRLTVFTKWAESAGLLNIKEVDISQLRLFQAYYFANAPFVKKIPHVRKSYNPRRTWEMYRQNMSAFFNWCVSRQLMPKNPLSNNAEFIIAVQKPTPRVFSAEELRKLFAFFDAEDQSYRHPYHGAFYRTLAYTGMRLSEAMELEWNAVDFATGAISVTKSKNKGTRQVPLHDALRPFLMALPRSTRLVFDDGRGGHFYDDSTWWKKLNVATTTLGLRPARLHDFRHTFCTMLGEMDVNLKAIAELAGHESIETTLRYVTFSRKKLSEVVGKIEI